MRSRPSDIKRYPAFLAKSPRCGCNQQQHTQSPSYSIRLCMPRHCGNVYSVPAPIHRSRLLPCSHSSLPRRDEQPRLVHHLLPFTQSFHSFCREQTIPAAEPGHNRCVCFTRLHSRSSIDCDHRHLFPLRVWRLNLSS